MIDETPTKLLLKQKFNPAVGRDNTTHQNAAGVNQLYFNNFLFLPIGRLVDKDDHPTAFLFQKLGFAWVSICEIHLQNLIFYINFRMVSRKPTNCSIWLNKKGLNTIN